MLRVVKAYLLRAKELRDLGEQHEVYRCKFSNPIQFSFSQRGAVDVGAGAKVPPSVQH